MRTTFSVFFFEKRKKVLKGLCSDAIFAMNEFYLLLACKMANAQTHYSTHYANISNCWAGMLEEAGNILLKVIKNTRAFKWKYL